MDRMDAVQQRVDSTRAGEELLYPLRQRGGFLAVIAAFAVLHGLLLQIGYAFKVTAVDPPVIWPAAGLALAALWMLPTRLWPAILAVQFLVETGTAALWMQRFDLALVTLYTLANMAGAVSAALLARARIRGKVFQRAREVLWFVLITAIGAAVSASIALPVHLAASGGTPQSAGAFQLWQLWAAGQWAGVIAIAPLLVAWLSPLRHHYPELRLRSPFEPVVLGALLVGTCFHVGGGATAPQSLLQLPTTIVLLMILAVMRLPPRWVVALFAVTAFTLAGLAAGTGASDPAPISIPGVGQLQIFIVTLGLFAFVLSVTLAERSIAARKLLDSEERYRSFIELSTEAMWRVEFSQPMPLSLAPAEQVQWLRAHACVAEASRSYARIDARAEPWTGSLAWDAGVPWMAALEARVAQGVGNDFTVDGLRFSVRPARLPHAFVAAFTGVASGGRLLRIWGVARDITELTELNANLLRERERLKSYARQIVTAEEKARRATAVDLHDGIGQSLAGMAMTLDVARQNASPEVKLLVEEVRARLLEVQEKTRSMISDLSPPGLYELGLKAALQWLAVYLRSHDQLQVEMDVDLREEAVPLETRVLVFKLVRELLRNVVKHAGVTAAALRVRGDAGQLRVHVADQGRGFEWQLDMFGARSSGFGLWSIIDRINEAGGEFNVDAAPGRGARFDFSIPLHRPGSADAGRQAATPGIRH